MRRLKKVVSAFLALLLLAVCPIYGEEPALAAEIQPRLRLGYYWFNTPRNVYFDLSALSSWYQTQAVSAMNIWNQVRTPDNEKMVTFLRQTSSSGYTANRINFEPMVSSTTLGQMTPNYTIELLSVKISLNSNKNWSAGGSMSAYDVKSVILHELGHALGIAHCHELEDGETCFSPTCKKNVMQPARIYLNTVRTTLQEYDTASYTIIYW